MPLRSATVILLLLLHLLSQPATATASSLGGREAWTGARSLLGGQREGGEQCCHAAGTVPSATPLNHSNLPKQIAFLVGAQKSGTTFMFHELVARHPKIKSHRVDICTPQKTKLSIPMKEPHYFDRIPLGNWERYLERFHLETDPSATYLDATPDYIHIPSTPCRIASVFPQAKIVVMLKDPVMRALSGWNMVRHQGKAGVKTFSEEVKHELDVLRKLQCSFELQPPISAGSVGRSRSLPGPAGANSSSAAGKDHRMQRSTAAARQRALTGFGTLRLQGPARPADTQQARAGPSKANATSKEVDRKPSSGTSSSSTPASTSPVAVLLAAPTTAVKGGGNISAVPVKSKGGGNVTEPAPPVSSPSSSPSPEGSGSPKSSKSSSGEREWRRDAALPSWNSCFRCDFSYCNGYTGPTDGDICRQDRSGTLGNLRRGLYVYQLEWWLHHFPADQLLVINYEHFVHDREGVLDMIITFLGQDPELKKRPEANKKKGFFTPHTSNATTAYSKVIDELYRFYKHPNEELYRLMASVGPAAGWSGSFPASFQQHLQRQAFSKPQLASMAVDEAAAVSKLRPSAADQASLEAGAAGKASSRGLLEQEETPWYNTMMASWKQHGCRQ